MKKTILSVLIALSTISSAHAVNCNGISHATAKRFKTGSDSQEILTAFCNVGVKMQVQGVDPHTFAAADAQQAASMVREAGIAETTEGKTLVAAMADAGRLGYNASVNEN
ncbi:hypothetical protein K9692_004522 [Escherichia coli]|nr:hypothetical protein [Escherichia coli]